MQRYFIEVAYDGTGLGGFQKQDNALTIQSQVESALEVYFRKPFELVGSSRTDAGVHALQNFFHFDSETIHTNKAEYHLNAILPENIVVKGIYTVAEDAHCRFSALSRSYQYKIYTEKNPFLKGRAYFFPFHLDLDVMQQAAEEVMRHQHFESFSKKNTQVHTYQCTISKSRWIIKDGVYIYEVTSNRFLRGMVRGLTGTMLKVGRGKLSLNEFKQLLEKRIPASADFSVPACGLCLVKVSYPFELI